MAITIHPDLHSLIPALTAEEFQQLEANILTEGCRDPLVVWGEEQVLLDGHNRHAICTKHERPYTVVELSLPDLDAAKAWMVTNQLGRRNLTPEQTSYLRGKQYELLKRQGARTDLTSRQSGEKLPSPAEHVAALHQSSVRTIERDAAFTRAVDAVAAVGGPDMRQMVYARKVGRQDVQRLATLAETSPQTAQEVLQAVQGAATPNQAKQIVQAAIKEDKPIATLAQAEARADAGILVLEPEASEAGAIPPTGDKVSDPLCALSLDADPYITACTIVERMGCAYAHALAVELQKLVPSAREEPTPEAETPCPLPAGMKQCKKGHAPYPESKRECPTCVRDRQRASRQGKAAPSKRS